MTDDKRCVCWHTRSAHDVGYGCTIGGEVVGGDREDCECPGFRPADEEKPSTESVYRRAREAMQRLWRPGASTGLHSAVHAALDAGEAAEKRAEAAERDLKSTGLLVNRMAAALELDPNEDDLCSEIECLLDAKEAAERERDALKARVAELEPAYLLEKERRIAAESKLKELCREVLTAGRYDHARDLAKALDEGSK